MISSGLVAEPREGFGVSVGVWKTDGSFGLGDASEKVFENVIAAWFRG